MVTAKSGRGLYTVFLNTIGLILFTATANAEALTRYRVVKDQDKYPPGVEISKHYRVLVKLASDRSGWDPVKDYTATYKLWPDYQDPETLPVKHKHTAVHIAQVDANQRIRVKVELHGGDTIKTLRLKPSRYRELFDKQSYGKTWLEFEAEPGELTKHILVEINAPKLDTDVLNDGLMFFFNPVSKVPKGKIMVLPSGVVGADYRHMSKLHSIIIAEDSVYDGLYIPQDTIVNGRIEVRKRGFVVAGRGMVVGSRWPFVKSVPGWRKRYPEWISPDGRTVKALVSDKSKDAADQSFGHFEGVTVVHPYHFCFEGARVNENLKAFGWRFSSDGIHGTIIRGSFTRVNDDANYINYGLIEHSTYWGMVNGAIFQLGWGLRNDNNAEGKAAHSDIVRGEWDNVDDPILTMLGAPEGVAAPTAENLSRNRGVFVGTYRTGAGVVRNKLFEDIRIDAAVNRLFYLGSTTGQVSFENFEFKDIWFEKQPTYEAVENHLHGEKYVKDFVFDNFRVAGKKIEGMEDLKPLDKKNVRDFIFK